MASDRNTVMPAFAGQGAMGQDQDDVVLMPIRAAQRRLTGNANDVSTLMLSLRDGVAADPVMEQIRKQMRERRKLSENADDDFNVMDTKQIAETLSGTIRTMPACSAPWPPSACWSSAWASPR